MKFEIETMRRQPDLAGYVITEFTDAYWESNGLLDFDRNPKVYHERFAAINAPDVIIPQPERYACWDDQQVRVTFYGAHYSAGPLGRRAAHLDYRRHGHRRRVPGGEPWTGSRACAGYAQLPAPAR